ncbi:M24 family metallopeptidase [Desulfosoma caldarium]|uniref:Xaa-Pro aminopeptidase n=1 Tax=Desulfosoma caldarium TaxID=610254 RepID=A0A3N1UER3_9BACT|nr:Xaa-Pro peptidase family protein [Desulfosoma caldarium]ROQ89892.1 Xaa-Pro aminopeptidase [Desulfosoma caldarium]
MLLVPSSEIAARIVAFQRLLGSQQVDAALIRQNTDLYYFSGTVQDAFLIIPASGPPVFAVRRDVQRAEQQTPLRPVIPLESLKQLPSLVDEATGRSSPRTLGMELDVLPTNTFFFFDEKLFPKDRLVDVSGLIRHTRSLKSSWELDMMRGAARISDTVARAVPQFLREGVREWDLLAELERTARLAGHLGFSRVRGFNLEIFFGHVLSGPEAAEAPYADHPTGGPGISPAFSQGSGFRTLRRGDLVSVDTMLNHNGYLNDQTRNFSLGPPHAVLQDRYALCRELHLWLREHAVPGAVTGELYDQLLDVVRKADRLEHFMGPNDSGVSFLGHGLGLEVDEFPFIAKGQKTVLREGMTFAFEPKWVVPGIGVAGFENTYVVTEHGAETLNVTPEDLVILP